MADSLDTARRWVWALAHLCQAWWATVRCALRGHPQTPRRVLYAGPINGVSMRDEWCSCACGRKSGVIKRTRIAKPYPGERHA